jgi:hypothetical protein
MADTTAPTPGEPTKANEHIMNNLFSSVTSQPRDERGRWTSQGEFFPHLLEKKNPFYPYIIL